MISENIKDILEKKVSLVKTQMSNKTFQSSVIELEARLYSNTKNHTIFNGHWENLAIALKKMNKRTEEMDIVSVSVNGYSDRVQLITSNGVTSLVKEIKYKLFPIDNDIGHWTRYYVSVEKPLKRYDDVDRELLNIEIEALVNRTKSLHKERVIKRTRYWIRDYIVVDMSIIQDEQRSLEIEVELINAGKNIDKMAEFVTITRKLVCLMRGSTYLYNSTVLETLATMVNMQLPAKTSIEANEEDVFSHHIDRAIFNNVRTIKKEDLVIGGIVGGFRNINYSAALKTDGRRNILIFSPIGVWICWPPMIYNLIDPTLSLTEGLSIFDGEEIPLEKRRDGNKTKYVFEIFDCLMIESRDVRKFNQEQRLKMCGVFMKGIYEADVVPRDLDITFKKMNPITSPDQFFYTIQMLLDEAKIYRYKTDGITFTPYNYHYWTNVDLNSADKKRSLVDVPEIVKWKPEELITIDFRLSIVDDKERLMVAEVEGNEIKEYVFKGTIQYPFDQDTMVNWDQVRASGLTVGSIGEFAWINKQYVFRNIRIDKQYPNTGSTVAEHNWEEVNSPLTEAALTGKNFRFMFFYHNKIKRELFKAGSRTLLSIGSGRGGEVWSWSEYDWIVACEPNEDHREEFKVRASKAGFRVLMPHENLPPPTKANGVEKLERCVILLNAKAEDTELIKEQVAKISPNGVNAISLIDVATFLWKDEKTLSKSMKTIQSCLSPGGVFIWKMMSGDRVRRIISPLYQKGIEDGKHTLTYGTFQLKYNVINGELQNEVKVFIPEGITTEGDVDDGWQTEYLTSVDHMIKNYFSKGYVSTKRKVADEEFFMNSNSTKLSSLYEYGVIKKEGSIVSASQKFTGKEEIKKTFTTQRMRRAVNK